MHPRRRKAPTASAVLIFLGSLCAAFVVLNRWIVTDLGVSSFGRLWQFYISYADFGFVRRGLVGTIFSETGVHSLFANEHVFGLAVQHLSIAAATMLIAAYCIKENLTSPVFLFGLAFSPAMAMHWGYATGTLDVFILLLAIVNILFVRNILVFCAVSVIGVLVHELFVFTLPAQILALHLNSKTDEVRLNKIVFLPAALSLLGAIIIVWVGQIDITQSAYEDILREKMPNAFAQPSQRHGYFEVSSSIGQNIGTTADLFSALAKGGFFLLIPAVVYLVLLTKRAMQYAKTAAETGLLIVVAMTPLFATFLANDVHRWFALSAAMVIIVTLRLAARDGNEVSKWNWAIASFCLIAPFGAGEVERPFPMQQFLIEKLMGS